MDYLHVHVQADSPWYNYYKKLRFVIPTTYAWLKYILYDVVLAVYAVVYELYSVVSAVYAVFIALYTVVFVFIICSGYCIARCSIYIIYAVRCRVFIIDSGYLLYAVVFY